MNSCFKIHAERAAAPDSDASYNCGFSKGKWPSASHHDGAAYTRHPWRGSADADIVSAFPLSFNTFQENINTLRQTSRHDVPSTVGVLCFEKLSKKQ